MTGTVVAVAGVLLAGCASTPVAEPLPSASASASPSTSASPTASASPTSTLSPEEQQAFEEATATALAFDQIVVDLYSGVRTYLNDLNYVATGDLLDQALRNVSKGISSGYKSVPAGAQVKLILATPVKVQLSRDVPRVILRACMDKTGITDVAPDGTKSRGAREEITYYVIRTTYLPPPGWAVKRMTAEERPEDRTC